jgi:hypothetical protein
MKTIQPELDQHTARLQRTWQADRDGGQQQTDMIFTTRSFCQPTHIQKKNMLANGWR